MRSGAGWLALEPQAVVDEFLGGLSAEALLALPWIFEFWALPHQLPPEGAWRTWVIMGGRGAGKTRAGAEWVRAEVEGAGPRDAGRARRVALIGETVDQVREVMVFGESGIIACAPPDRKPVWEASRKRLVWPNGAVAQVMSAHDPEGLRGPQFDAAWADEYGCAALDRATNQPNLFLDANSSESALPRASRAMRDDLAQMQYYRAMAAYWADPAHNPVSALYGGPMVDMDHAHAWAWDARPFRFFPGRSDLWGDAGNYDRGHWLNGRVSTQPLAAVVAELAERAGIGDVDLSGLNGLVRGYALDAGGTGRGALQPLMLAAGFDAYERDGTLVFRSRDAGVKRVLTAERLVDGGEEDFDITLGSAAEMIGRLRVSFVEAEADYAARVTEAAHPALAEGRAADQEVPLVLLAAEARGIAERWLAESRVGRDSLRLTLPPSLAALGAGDVFGFAGQRWRIDRLEQADALGVEAVRVEPGVYVPAPTTAEAATLAAFAAPAEVFPLFLDLPLLKGSEVPHAPHVAVAADPWPGRVAVWVSGGEDDFALESILTAPATIGVTETPLLAARSGLWDRGEPLRVAFEGGALASAPALSVLNGANLAAIGDGSADRWEVFQFAAAVLVAPDTWEVSLRLRGQCGTDGVMPAVWPVGSKVVLIDRALQQLDVAPETRGLARTWRIGAALRGYADPSVVTRSEAFAGNGLRPYPVAHLRAVASGGDRSITWVRRTRLDGDSWISAEVPLGEEREAYVLRVTAVDGSILRQVTLAEPRWTYGAAMRLADGAGAVLSVAQQSDRFGTGPFRGIAVF